MKNNLKTGLVIVNYNRSLIIHNILKDFKAYESIDKIVIVDNHSSDKDIIKNEECDKVHIIWETNNNGYAKGNNTGINYLKNNCKCNYIFIANPDVYFSNSTIEDIINAFNEHPEFAIITCARIDPDKNGNDLQYLKKDFNSFTKQLCLYFAFIKKYILMPKHAVYTYNNNNRNIISISESPGSFFGIKISYYTNNCVFDEKTFLFGEEMILAYKTIKQMHYKIGFLSYSLYEHRHKRYASTTSLKSIKSYKFALQSRRYFQKNYLKFNSFQLFILKLAEYISLLERFLFYLFK